MRTRKFAVLLALAAGVLAAAGIAMASDPHSETAAVKNATNRYHDVAVAEDAGYAELKDLAGIACIESAAGGMGIHYANVGLVLDGQIDPLQPEAVVYEPRDQGKALKLVAVEYVVLAEAWDAGHLEPPSLFGREFDFTPAGNRYGLPDFYSLHAWIGKPNPAGYLEPYNPRIDC
jgi:hypothetical protein